MNIFIGLGNPGKQYLNTRHNVGHQFIDFLKTHNLPHSKSNINTGYMNEAGLSVQKIVNFYKVDLRNFYLIHDDLDLPVGEWRLQFDRGPAGHHGVESVIAHLNSQAFNRIRIGIGKPQNQTPIEEYVLQNFSSDEKKLINNVFDQIIVKLKQIVAQ